MQLPRQRSRTPIVFSRVEPNQICERCSSRLQRFVNAGASPMCFVEALAADAEFANGIVSDRHVCSSCASRAAERHDHSETRAATEKNRGASCSSAGVACEPHRSLREFANGMCVHRIRKYSAHKARLRLHSRNPGPEGGVAGQ